MSLPPGPRYPAAIQMIGFWKRPLAYLERLRARYGKTFTLRLPASPPLVVLTRPEDVKAIYTAPPDVLAPGQGARILEPIVGANSVILLDGDPHMSQRKLILPSFHGERMERLTGLIEEVTEREVASWADEPELALAPKMQRLTLEIILRAVFGLDPGPRLDALRSRLSALAAYGDKPITMLLPPPPDSVAPVLDRIGPAKGFVRLRDEIDALLFELIEERRADEAGNSERDDVLSTLLEARHEDGSPMSDQELRDELMTLLLAGHETTASTLAWAFERLVRTPAALERLVAEATESEADADGPYLAATIQETLRCRPVLPNTAPRLVVEPIEVGGRRYEPGRAVLRWSPTPICCTTIPTSIPTPTRSGPSAFSTRRPAPTPGSRSGAGAGAASAPASRRSRCGSSCGRSCAPTTCGRSPPAHEHAVRRNITVRPGAGSRIGIGRRPAPVSAAR